MFYSEELEVGDLRPIFNFWGAQLSHYLHDLADFRLGLEENASLAELIKNAA